MYAGSFDPVTLGHWNIINRASRLVDELVVLVSFNPAKNYMFTPLERLEFIRDSSHKPANVTVYHSDRLVVEVAKTLEAQTIFRGLRPHGDFEPEYGMATINADLAPQIETLFLIADAKSAAISSSAVKQLAAFKQDIDKYVDYKVGEAIRRKIP